MADIRPDGTFDNIEDLISATNTELAAMIEPVDSGRRNQEVDLSKRSWWHDLPSPADDADLLRLIKYKDDAAAKEKHFKNWDRTLKEFAREYHGPPWEERYTAAIGGYCEALHRCDPRRNNGFYAYAFGKRGWVRKFLDEACMEWRRRGQSIQKLTRADRYVYYNRDATAEDVVRAVYGEPSKLDWVNVRRLRDAQGAIDRAKAYWHGHRSYDTREAPYHQEEGKRPYRAPIPTRNEMGREFDCYSPWQLSPQLRLHDGIRCNGPTDIICVLNDAGIARTIEVFGVSPTIDALAISTDKRTERRLSAYGRRAYALEIERRDWERALKYDTALIPLFARTPMAYCIPSNTSRTAVTMADSAKWKSDADKLRATAEVQPLVFDEKDKWGWYRSRQDRRPKNETSTAAEAAERNEHDSFPQQRARHQASRGRSANGSCRGDARGGASGHDDHVRHFAARSGYGA